MKIQESSGAFGMRGARGPNESLGNLLCIRKYLTTARRGVFLAAKAPSWKTYIQLLYKASADHSVHFEGHSRTPSVTGSRGAWSTI